MYLVRSNTPLPHLHHVRTWLGLGLLPGQASLTYPIIHIHVSLFLVLGGEGIPNLYSRLSGLHQYIEFVRYRHPVRTIRVQVSFTVWYRTIRKFIGQSNPPSANLNSFCAGIPGWNPHRRERILNPYSHLTGLHQYVEIVQSGKQSYNPFS